MMPNSYAELPDYSRLVRYVGRVNGVQDHMLDDFEADIYLAFIEGDYLTIYDPKRSKFATFLWAFVEKRAWSLCRKENRNLRQLVSIDLNGGNDFSEFLAEPLDFISFFESCQNLEVSFKMLSGLPPYEMVVWSDGFKIERSLYTLSVLLFFGFNQKEIASIYRRSVGTVNAMMVELRGHFSRESH